MFVIFSKIANAFAIVVVIVRYSVEKKKRTREDYTHT